MNETPTPGEIIQHEPPSADHPVPTYICGPVDTRELPAAGPAGYRTETAVGVEVGVKLLATEPRRKSATILATGDVWLASTQAGAQAGAAGAMRWPAGLPKTIEHMHEVWVCAVTGTTDVSVETVKWSY